jgi:hypothetical protein
MLSAALFLGLLKTARRIGGEVILIKEILSRSLCCFIPLLFLFGCSADEKREAAPGLGYLQSQEAGKGFDAFFAKANREGELFRRSLIDEGMESGRARLLWKAINKFCEEPGQYLQGRKGVESFRMEWQDFKDSISGEKRLEAQEVYGGFTGRWYGLWDRMEVDHYWGKIVEYEQPKEVKIDGEDSVWVRNSQYCWVGDGYGLNVIATDSPERSGDFLLGYVIHIQDGDMTKTTKERPHVGVYAGKGKVIWITEGEVFLEETHEREGEDTYTITGFFYEAGKGVLRSKECFQATYTRRAENRPAWYSFPLKIKVSGAGK